MTILPVKQETIVSSLNKGEVAAQLSKLTSPPSLSKKDIDQHALFIGEVEKDSFKISLKIDAPENFLPIIYGTIDQTSIGCIIYLKFRLFFSSVMFLTFWSSICFLVFVFFTIVMYEKLYAHIAISAGITNYLVTVFYFNRKVKESHTILMEALKADE